VGILHPETRVIENRFSLCKKHYFPRARPGGIVIRDIRKLLYPQPLLSGHILDRCKHKTETRKSLPNNNFQFDFSRILFLMKHRGSRSLIIPRVPVNKG